MPEKKENESDFDYNRRVKQIYDNNKIKKTYLFNKAQELLKKKNL